MIFEGGPCLPLYIRGDRVTWKVLAKYSWSPTTTRSGSFLFTAASSTPIRVVTREVRHIHESADLDEKRVPPELDSDNPENVSTLNRTLGSVKFDTNSDSEKLHFSKTLGKYLAHLKTIKCLKIKNLGLLAGVDQVSQSIEGCIKLAETPLGSSTS